MNSGKIWEDYDFSVSLHEFRTVMSHFFITKAPSACGAEVKDSSSVFIIVKAAFRGCLFFVLG